MVLPFLVALIVACGQTAPAPPPPPVSPGLPDSQVEPPTARIFPGTEAIPANALSFELRWSKAMRLGPQGIEVSNEADQIVEGALVRARWDGPIENAFVDLAPLPPGVYTLRIYGFASTDGGMADPVEHPFRVVPADTTPPDGSALKVLGQPAAGSLAPLTIRFDEPVHHGAVDSVTALGGGGPWEGEWTLDPTQTTLSFTPTAPWPDQPVRVSVGAGVMDLAGNGIAHRPPGLITPTVELSPAPRPAPE